MARTTSDYTTTEKGKPRRSRSVLSRRKGYQEFILDRNYVLDLVNSLESLSAE